jgi:hypothetical protein
MADAPMMLPLPVLFLLAVTPEVQQSFLGIGLGQGDGCVTALLVLPDGPAAQAGLREGECVARVGAETVSRIEEMQAAAAASRPGVATTLTLADGKTLTVVPVPRSNVVERRFCRYRAKVRPRVYVTLLEGDGGGDTLDGVFSVGALRERFGAKGHAQVIFGNSCSDGPTEFRVEPQPSEDMLVPDDAQVQFGYDAPGPRHYIFFSLDDSPDGGVVRRDSGWRCRQRDGKEVPWVPDGGQPCPVLIVPDE